MPVRAEDVRMAVEVVVEEKRPEGQGQETVAPDRTGRRFVDEEPVALVVEEVEHFVGEVAHQQVEAAAPVVVGGIHAHRPAGLAILGVRDAGRDAVFAERAVAFVPVQLVRLGVVRLEDVGPTVGVIVEDGDAERLGGRIVDARAHADVLEGAVSPVAVQDGRLPLVGLRRAVALGGPVHRAPQVLVDRPLDVVRHEEVEMPVEVVVQPGRARPEPGVGDACRACRVLEGAVSPVAVQPVAVQHRHVQVDEAVVVVVGGRRSQSVQRGRQTRLVRRVGEPAAAFVPV